MKFIIGFLVVVPLIKSDNQQAGHKVSTRTVEFPFGYRGEAEFIPPAFDMIPDTFIEPTSPIIYPFVGAIMTDDFKYVCSAAVVSRNMLLTALDCISNPIKYVMVRSSLGIQNNDSEILSVMKSLAYRAPEGDIPIKVAILYTTPHSEAVKGIRITGDTNWNLNKPYKAIGFGLNSVRPDLRELQYVMLYRFKDLPQPKSKSQRCFNDVGGPVFSNFELVGVITKGLDGCMKNITEGPFVEMTLAINFKHWVDERIMKAENNLSYPHVFMEKFVAAAPIEYSLGTDDETNLKLIILASLAILISYF